MLLRDFIKRLGEVLENSCQDNREFMSAEFFKQWFTRHGNAYFFLFTKNLQVTNLQFAELISLLRTYIHDTATEPRNEQLLFLSTRDFKDSIQDIVSQHGKEHLSSQHFEEVATLYGELIRRTIVVDLFHGSAAVFIPGHLDIDLLRVCSLSGYIHSCGRTVYIRATDKLAEDDLRHKIKDHLHKFPSENEKPVLLTAYAHEDITDDRHMEARLRDGLDDVKLHVEKFFVGDRRLPGFLADIRNELPNRVLIPPPGDNREARKNLVEKEKIDQDRTIWLIRDRGVEPGLTAAPQQYLICYDQLYANHCPFQLFDENKPAWVAQTTIPHSLMRAMLNLSLPWRKDDVQICDPFVGTGTTWLEALKFEDAKAEGSDLDPITPLLVQDNLSFFTTPARRLRQLANLLQRWEPPSTAAEEDPVSSQDKHEQAPQDKHEQDREWGLAMAEEFISTGSGGDSGEIRDHEWRRNLPKKLKSASFHKRLMFYVGLRAHLKYEGAYARNSLDVAAAFAREARVLSREIEDLIDWRRKVSDQSSERDGNIIEFPGTYSKECSIAPGYLKQLVDEDTVTAMVFVRDCRELPENSFDVIVADPPYGFNTDASSESLAELYQSFIRQVVAALRDNGQLVLCLPARSYTGRPLPICSSRRNLVVHQVLVAADLLERDVVIPAMIYPVHGEYFRPPYYWEAEKALRRAVLHFRVRDRVSHICSGNEDAR